MAISDSCSYVPTLKSSDLADKVADLPPKNGDFRFLLRDSYTEGSDLADKVADHPPEWEF